PHGFEQILRDEVGAVTPGLALVFEFAAPVAREHKSGARARVSRKLGVAVTVADHPAVREVEAEVARGPEKEPRLRLAAVAVEPVRRLARGRVVRAVIDGVEACAAAREFVRQLLMN